MGTEIEDQIARLAAQWDSSVAPVSADEARGRPSGMGELDIDSVLAPVHASPDGERQRRWIWMAAAASIVVLIVAVVALVREPSNGSISPAPPESTSPTTVATEETAVATSVAEVVEEPLQEVSAVQALVIERLSTLQGFTATATVHTTQTALDGSTVPTSPAVTSVNEVTVMADGSLWIQGDLALWSSYDASTGVSRIAFPGAEGSITYQEVVGWTDNSTPLLIALQYDPVMRFDTVQNTIVEQVQSQLSRPAWRLTASFDFGNPEDTDAFSQEEVYTIDKESGLIVEYHRVSINNGVEDRTEAFLADLQLDANLPAEFPGSFPDGAAVDRSGNSDGFTLVTPETATAQFGSVVHLPAVGDSTMRIVMSSVDMVWGELSVPATNVQLAVELRIGFAKRTVVIAKTVLQPGAELTEPGVAVVDGAICPSTDGASCSDDGQGTVITEGALAGAPSNADGTSITASLGPVHYMILATTGDEALAIANSFS